MNSEEAKPNDALIMIGKEISSDPNEELVGMLTRWSHTWEEHILQHGSPLPDRYLKDAERIGVESSHKVRILIVPTIPMPPFPLVYERLIAPCLLEPMSKAFNVGYGIMVRPFYQNMRWILTHELVHVMQHERLGGTEAAIRNYLNQLFSLENGSTPMEVAMEIEANELSLKCMREHPE